jgi:hypothetical protein
MLLYRERLRVPASWWLAGAVCVLILGTTLAAGLSVVIGVAIYVAMGALLATGFAVWGSVAVRVTDSELSAGQARLAIDQVSDVSTLDAAQTAALRGPRADIAAFMLVRPYLATSVYVAVAGRPASRPYLLIATRRPADLAAAILAAVSEAGHLRAPGAGRQAAPDAACDDDDPDDHAAELDGIGPVDAAHLGKDGNAW